MKLAEWRLAQNISRAELARRCGIRGAETVRRWEIGERVPQPRHAARLFKITGGEVTPNDFHDFPNGGG